MYVASDSQRIRDAVSVEDVLKRYHQLGRAKGRTSCPLHGGTNDNLGYSERVWHCFVCGAKGDVIGFVMQLFGMDFPDAIAKIAQDFGITLNNKSGDIRQKHQSSMQDTARKIAEMKRQREFDKIKSEYWGAFDEYVRHDKNMYNYAPKSINEEPHPLFTEALQNIGYATYKLREADAKLNDYERNCRHS